MAQCLEASRGSRAQSRPSHQPLSLSRSFHIPTSDSITAMAVNTAALKTFAPAMRRQLMEAVGRKLDLLLNSQTPDTLSTYAKQIAELRDEQEKSREQLLERVAYTWFNRLCALRYLDAKGWHPFGCKVLMPADGSETQPELLKLMRSGSLPADLKPSPTSNGSTNCWMARSLRPSPVVMPKGGVPGTGAGSLPQLSQPAAGSV